MPPTQPEKKFRSQGAFEKWIEANHDKSDGIWIVFAKKASGIASVDYPQALDVALCFGWIDGQRNSIDETWYKQRFTPRRKRSIWSKRNREHVARLVKEKRMRPAGMAQVKAAKADGRWDAAYDSHSTFSVPDDFAAALKKNRKALAAFEKSSKANQFGMCTRLQMLKRDSTRATRIEEYVTMLANGDVLHT